MSPLKHLYLFVHRHRRIALLMLSLISLQRTDAQFLSEIKNFSPNPGQLKAYIHLPPDIKQGETLPMLVVLHGCLQNAGIVAKQSGWNELADRHRFIVVYAQQQLSNNIQNCFCWFNPEDVDKGKGENGSIMSIMLQAERSYPVDTSKVFITGLSAGAAMAVSLMATYPDHFKAGAIFAGAPFKVASRMITGYFAMQGWVMKSPRHWGELVRQQNPGYTGSYPRMIIYQGRADVVVNRRNGNELVKQWTNVLGMSAYPSRTMRPYAGKKCIRRQVYLNRDGQESVVYYQVKGLGHALMIDPGKCEQQGGRTRMFSRDMNYHSSYWTAVDFGLVQAPQIGGKREVGFREQALEFEVPDHPGSRYHWALPRGCKVISKEGHKVRVNWGQEPGTLNVTERKADGCRIHYQSLYVGMH